MFRSLIVLALTLSTAGIANAGSTGANPCGEAMSDADRDKKINTYMKASVQLEIDALSGLITAMKKANEKTDAKQPSDAAKAAHKAGAALYQEAKGMAEASDYKGAYLKLREAWKAHEPANDEFVAGAPKEVLEGISAKLLGMLKERIQMLDSHITKAPEGAKITFKAAKTSYEEAKSLNGSGNDKEAISKAHEAILSLHQTLVTTWKIAK